MCEFAKAIGIFFKAPVLGNYENKNIKPDFDEVGFCYVNFVLCGDLSYLGLEGYTSDTIKEMLSLVDESTLVKDTLGLTPVYLKD